MPSLKIIVFLFLEKNILKGFAIHSHGGHLGHVTWAIYTNFHSHFPMMLHIKFGFNWPSGFRDENFVELYELMLHAKFQNHQPSGSGEEDF